MDLQAIIGKSMVLTSWPKFEQNNKKCSFIKKIFLLPKGCQINLTLCDWIMKLL